MGDYLARWNERRDKRGPLALRWVVTSMNISESSSIWMFGHAVVEWSYPAAVQSLTQWNYMPYAVSAMRQHTPSGRGVGINRYVTALPSTANHTMCYAMN